MVTSRSSKEPADGHVAQLEGARFAGMFKIDLVVELAFEQDLSVLHLRGMRTDVHLARLGRTSHPVRRLEGEGKFGQRYDADRQDGLLAEEFVFHNTGFGFVE